MLNTTTAPDGGEPRRTNMNTPVIADWFHNCVTRGKKEVFCDIVRLTPEMAKYLLNENRSNRLVRAGVLETYKQDILKGRWALNGESIKIARDGSLIDGQHRCWAVAETGKTIKTLIMFGLDFDCRMTVDQGASRSSADYLAMEGVKYVKVVSGIARVLLHDKIGGGGARDGVTKLAIRSEYWENAAAYDSAAAFVVSKNQRVIGGQIAAAAALVVCRRISPSADDFIERFITGADLPPKSPILTVRNKILAQTRGHTIDRMRMICRAFDAWLEDKPLTRIFLKSKAVKKAVRK